MTLSDRAELMRQFNERNPTLELPDGVSADGLAYGGPNRDFTGGYAFARYQIRRRGYLGSRFHSFQDELAAGETTNAISGYLEFFPSEFSKLVVRGLRHRAVRG
jgi:hypothetical protein